MSKLQCSNHSSRLFATAGSFGEINLVARAESVLIDASTRHYDSAGHLHRDQALAELSVVDAMRLRDALDAAIEHAATARLADRQTQLWSEASYGAAQCGGSAL